MSAPKIPFKGLSGLSLAAAGLAGASLLGRRLLARPLELSGRVALVTGGSRGLGLILARQLAGAGARVAICSRSGRQLERARKELVALGAEALAVACDVADRAQVDRMVAEVVSRFGSIDLLVNNASIIQVGPVEAMSEKDFTDAMAVNFWGTVNATLAALPHLRREGEGRIVNITSIGGDVAVPHLLPYTAAKFAARGFSEGLRAELAKQGIRVVTVVPGLMRTGSFINALFKGRRSREFAWFALGSALPLVSMDAERAARRILRAARHGEPFVTVGTPAKLLRLAHGLLPGLAERALSLVNRALPEGEPGDRESSPEPGWRHGQAVRRTGLTALGDRAARKFHEESARDLPPDAGSDGLAEAVGRRG
jgi:NAD(P)-dependent dehydrogenase (short-subunit alcohol dehydrogenase family)